MKKYIVVIFILLTVVFLVYYFSRSFRKTDENVTGSVSPVPTVTQAVNIPDNWKTYKDETLGYSINYPDAYSAESNGDFSILIVKTKKQPSVGPANFVYVSVVPPGQSTNQGEVYNYDQVQLNKLSELGIGESVSVADTDQPDLNAWYTYQRIDDTQIDGRRVKVFENKKPWEFPAGTTEVRYVFESQGSIYLMGYYYGGENLEEPIDPGEAYRIISSFKTN